MKIGYARVSSKDQNLTRQIHALKIQKVDKIFQEKKTGKNFDRNSLSNLLSILSKDDEVVITSLDRLGRNSAGIKSTIESIKNKGATLNILDLPSFHAIENKNLRQLLNSLLIDLFSYVAESEREMILKRQREGIELAKRRGVYKGKKKNLHLKIKMYRLL